MRPLSTNVLLRWDQAATTTIITRDYIERPKTGTIVGIGTRVNGIQEGDHVLFRDSFSAHKVPDHDDLLVMDQSNILLILEK